MRNENLDFIFSVYGSKLYGTATPTSDTDEKVIYLPALNGLLLGKKPKIFKVRVDADGNHVADNATMPDGGRETEYIPIQQFVHDFIHGQTYALEVAHAYKHPASIFDDGQAYFIEQLIKQFGNSDVYSMTGFAMKQTFDYVHRGERLNEARKVLAVLKQLQSCWVDPAYEPSPLRLDTLWSTSSNTYVLDVIVKETGLKESTSTSNNRVMRTLELNGRSYLETTTIEHLITLVKKKVEEYGERTNKAADTDVDFKSLSHAVRVYQQAIELLDTGKMTFPRPNVEFLLSIKQGRANLEEVKQLLKDLDVEVQQKIETSTVRKRTPELEVAAEKWLLSQLRELYGL